MHIINIKNKVIKFKFQLPNPKSQTIPNSQFPIPNNRRGFPYLHLFGIWCLVIGVLSGCAQKNYLEKAQDYAKQSQVYYQRAVASYKDLIKEGKDLDRLHLELGQLYYTRGEFKQAIEEFKKTNYAEAKKFLAISYFRMGNFTDALEQFTKNEFSDDETLYYYGLTSERLNLYDKAQGIYNKVTGQPYRELVRERLDKISRLRQVIDIEDLGPNLQKIILDSPKKELYPEAGAFILLNEEDIEVTEENTAVYKEHCVIKILNERGKKDFSEVAIGYDSTYEKVELLFARTIKPDGKVVYVGAKHIRDVSKYLNFPLYSNARAFIISMPEITEGATIEYRIKIYRNQLINKKDFILNYRLQENEPVILANFKLILPKDKKVHTKILNEDYNNFNAKLNPQVLKEDNRLIYKWEFRNLPQIIPEPNMPADVEINPAILISTFESWGEIYTWWWSLAKDKMKTSNSINKKIEELIKDLKTDEEKIRAIYNFCAKEIRYVAVEYGEAGFEPHKAEEIFINKYGDCKDQAILLVTMLKEAGFIAWPVLIATKEYYNLNEDFPSVLFNHCIAAVSIEDKVVFLDPTAETCSFGDLPADDQDRKVLVFKEDGYNIQHVLLYPSEHNLIKQQLNIKVNKDETISAQKIILSYGIYDQAQRYWCLYTQPELIELALKEKIQELSIGAKLERYSIDNLDDLNIPVVLSYSFKGPEYFTAAGNLRIMPQLASLDTSMVAKDKRKYAIDFTILDNKESIFTIEIPDNFVIKYIPQSIIEDSPWLRFIVEYNRKDNKIYFRQKTELKKTLIPETQYPDFKNFFEGLAKKIKQRIVLEGIR